MADIYWPGTSGRNYGYWIHPLGTRFKNVPGNYVFAREIQPGTWSPIYIGQSEDLGSRLANHEKERCARLNGATHIHVHTTEGGLQARLSEEADLISRWKPPCNTQGK